MQKTLASGVIIAKYPENLWSLETVAGEAVNMLAGHNTATLV
jgi:hypothetical protein